MDIYDKMRSTIAQQMNVIIARQMITKSNAAKVLDVAPCHLSKILSGLRLPSLDLLVKFSIAFKCNIQIDYRDYIDTEDVKNAD